MRALLLLPGLVAFTGCVARIPSSSPVTTAAAAAPVAEPAHTDRRAADEAAQRALMKLHFAAEGRGMHLSPGYLRQYHAVAWTGLTNLVVRDRWGFTVENGQVAGLFDVRYPKMTVGAAGCAACHSGKAAGRFYPGLGNKNMDVTQLGMDLYVGESRYAALTPFTGPKRDVEQSAIGFAKVIGDPEIGNLTQGMVPVSLIFGWFYQQSGEHRKPETRGAVKVPALWGYASKRPAGLFCDGIGVGDPPGWAVAVELTAGQKPETVREYLPAIERAEQYLAALLPAPYPFVIDRAAARRGHEVFEQNCAGCHGTYARGADGLPRLQSPRWVAHKDVATDADRLELVTDELVRSVKESPMRDLIKMDPKHRNGYFAPRLEGIWARFPYLHNGSVPNIRALLSPPDARPRVFSLKRAGERDRFDEERLGLTLPSAREEGILIKRGDNGARDVYDTRRLGHSPQGHAFGTRMSQTDRQALIEYLKTL